MKSLTAIFLALIITLSLTACASSPAETVPTELETQPSASQPAAAAEDPRVAEYDAALALLEEGSFDRAKEAFLNLGSYSDAENQAKECDYRKAAALLAAGENRAAWELYGQISGYKDADTLRESCRFGMLLTKTTHEIQGEVRYEITHVYESGQLAEEITRYNEQHPQYIQFHEKNPVLRTVYEYDGSAVTLYTYDAADSLQNIEMRYYDEAGNLIRVNKIFVRNAANSYTCAYTYNEQGLPVEELRWSGDGIGEGDADKRYVTEYDSDGNRTRYMTYSSGYGSGWRLDSYSTYDYGMDDSGRIYWVTNVSTGGTTEYTYNSRGLVETERIYYPGSENHSTITYTYDEQGTVICTRTVYLTDGEEFVTAIHYTYEPVALFPGDA